MDHLAKRHQPWLFPIRVRHLCTYDRYVSGVSWEDWVDYPTRNGWEWNGQQYGKRHVPQGKDDTTIEASLIEGNVFSDALDVSGNDSLIQKWLWFGLLEEVTTIKLNQADFVLTSNPLGRPLTEHEEARRLLRQQLVDAGIKDLPDIPDELDSIPSGPILTTVKLNDHLLAWKAKMNGLCPEERLHNAKISRHLLRLAYAHAEKMCKSWHGSFVLEEPHPISGPLSNRGAGTDQAIILSVFVLIETLEEACMHATDSWYHQIRDYYPAQPEILIRRFKRTSWCPNRILWATSMGVCTAYVLSSSGLGDIAEQHKGCTENVCRLNNVDESTYQTRHAFLACDDPYHSSESPDSASKIVADGGIPIVYFDGRRLQVVPYTEGGPSFTAISHVWSGGLGNVHENALPECQLEQLQRTIDELNLVKASRTAISNEEAPGNNTSAVYRTWPHGDWDDSYPEAPYMRKLSENFRVQSKYYFWIDTLCIPLRPADLRKAAIRQIAKVFQQAAQVLVIDARVRLNPVPGSRPNFTLYRVAVPEVIEAPDISTNDGLLVDLASSNWMRRLWTFSEGALAKEIYVELKQGFILYDHFVWGALHNYESIICNDGLKRLAEELVWVRRSQPVIQQNISFTGGLAEDDGLTSHAEILRFPSVQARVFYEKVVAILTVVSIRTTTKREDESICIANALDIPLRQIQEHGDPSHRMRQLLLAIEFVPAEILFLAAPKLKGLTGFSWAPWSFLSGGVKASMSAKPIARVTETGLLHQAHALTFHSTCPDLDTAGYVFKIRGDTNAQVFHVRKAGWSSWDASEEFVACDSEFLDGLTERWSERVLDAEAKGINVCTTFVLFTAVRQIGGYPRSIGAVCRVVYDDSSLVDESRVDESLVEKDDSDRSNLGDRNNAGPILGGPSHREDWTDRVEQSANNATNNTLPTNVDATISDLGRQASYEQNTGAVIEADPDFPESPSESSMPSIVTVKYEFAAFITTHSEGEFGTMFTALEAQPVADMMNFFFLADEIDDDQLWKIT